METLRILIVDDDKGLRKSLRMFLNHQPGWQVVGEGANGREGIEEAERLKPDLTIMDLNMPEVSGIEATREIRRAAPDSAILVLTEHNSVPLVCEALEAGAHGFLPKSEVRQLVSAVKKAISKAPAD
ncbi:MAG TPA: response regulator transcription factor [Terriglobia bacterium]|jgi:DNA-binding NarL/FixJ family response regulator|nr:response regulator transcription factor [Terriglobia bacterium]